MGQKSDRIVRLKKMGPRTIHQQQEARRHRTGGDREEVPP